jgi:hypothetical protein
MFTEERQQNTRQHTSWRSFSTRGTIAASSSAKCERFDYGPTNHANASGVSFSRTERAQALISSTEIKKEDIF